MLNQIFNQLFNQIFHQISFKYCCLIYHSNTRNQRLSSNIIIKDYRQILLSSGSICHYSSTISQWSSRSLWSSSSSSLLIAFWLQAQQERLSFIHSQGSSEDHEYDQVVPHDKEPYDLKITAGAFAAAASAAGEAFRLGRRRSRRPSGPPRRPPGPPRRPPGPPASVCSQPDPPCRPTVGPGCGRERPRHRAEKNQATCWRRRCPASPPGARQPVQQCGEAEQESEQVAESRSWDWASHCDRPPHNLRPQQDRLPRQPLRVVNLLPWERGCLRPVSGVHQPQPWHLLVHVPRRHGALRVCGKRAWSRRLHRIGSFLPNSGRHRSPVLKLGKLSGELVLLWQWTQTKLWQWLSPEAAFVCGGF